MSAPPRVGLVGWYGYGNVGDDLLLRLLVDRLRPALVFSTRAGSTDGIDILPVETLPARADELDLLLIGGGGLLNDRWIAKLALESLDVPFGLLAVGIPHARWLGGMGSLLERARFVTLRDHLALETFRETYPHVNAWWLPDPGFMLPRRAVDKRPRVVLNPRKLPPTWLREDDPKDAEERMLLAMRRIVRRVGDQVEVLALGFEESDREVLEALPCPGRVVGYEEAVAEIAASTVLVTARLHGGIIAATQGTHAVLVDYQDKIRGLSALRGERAFPLAHPARIVRATEAVLALAAPADTAVPAAYGALIGRVVDLMSA